MNLCYVLIFILNDTQILLLSNLMVCKLSNSWFHYFQVSFICQFEDLSTEERLIM